LASVAILRLGETCARRSAEQQHACRSCDQLATHHNEMHSWLVRRLRD
jgi:hypothetical protein